MSEAVYLAVEPECGCVTGATVDVPEYAKDTAKEISAWVRDGRSVQRVQLAADDTVPIKRCPHWRYEKKRRIRTDVPIESPAR